MGELGQILEAAATAAPELSADAAVYSEQLNTIINLLGYSAACLILLVAICAIILIVKTFSDMARS